MDDNLSSDWEILAESHAALCLVAQRLSGIDKRSFRATCTAARAAVDSLVSSIQLVIRTTPNLSEGAETEGREAVGAEASMEQGAGRSEPDTTLDPPDFACGNWPHLQALAVYGLKHADSLRKIVREAAQRWPRLQELRFIGCAAAAVLPDLAAQPLLHLQELELSECDLAKEDVALLATLHAPRLRELDLSASGVPCLDALSSSNWPRLAALSLCANPRLGVPAALSLAAETFPRLADLDLSGTMLLPAAVAALVAAPLPMLEWLRLSECRLSDEALLPLASASWPRLQLLDLAHNNLRSDAAMQYLATAELPNLWSLDISGNSDLHASALQALSTARWPRLERFSASYLPLSSKGVSGLIAAEMPRLAVLTLYECTMPWVAVDRLASAKNWPCLRRLNLGGSCSGVQGRRAGPSLAVAEWPSLKTLVLRQTKMSSVKAKTAVRREQMQLRERWPDLKILYE